MCDLHISFSILETKYAIHEPYSVDIAQTRNDLAMVYYEIGRYVEAESLLRDTLEIRTKVLHETSPAVIEYHWNLALVYAAAGQHFQALELMKKCLAMEDKMINEIFSVVSEDRRITYLQKLKRDFHTFMSLVLEYFSKSAVEIGATFDQVLLRKAMVLETLRAQRNSISNRDYESKLRLNELHDLRIKHSNKLLAGPGQNESLETHYKILFEWDKRIAELQSELRNISEIKLESQLRSVNRQTIFNAIPTNVALVEFIRLDIFNFPAAPFTVNLDGNPHDTLLSH